MNYEDGMNRSLDCLFMSSPIKYSICVTANNGTWFPWQHYEHDRDTTILIAYRYLCDGLMLSENRATNVCLVAWFPESTKTDSPYYDEPRVTRLWSDERKNEPRTLCSVRLFEHIRGIRFHVSKAEIENLKEWFGRDLMGVIKEDK